MTVGSFMIGVTVQQCYSESSYHLVSALLSSKVLKGSILQSLSMSSSKMSAEDLMTISKPVEHNEICFWAFLEYISLDSLITHPVTGKRENDICNY